MRTRRLPTGGLAALAVLLAALAVVIVAGSPPPRTIVERVRAPTTTTSLPHPGRALHRTTSHHAVETGVRSRHIATFGATTREATTTQGRAPASAPSSSTTTTTTTTIRGTVTTTTGPTPVGATAGPVSRDGTFSGGQTSVTARVGAVRGVTVSVSAGVKVTLSVACGLIATSVTSVSTATVRVHGSGGACTATFSVPSASPQPAPWRLVTW